eukprot:169385-Hanusia_phi.AAC.1
MPQVRYAHRDHVTATLPGGNRAMSGGRGWSRRRRCLSRGPPDAAAEPRRAAGPGRGLLRGRGGTWKSLCRMAVIRLGQHQVASCLGPLLLSPNYRTGPG